MPVRNVERGEVIRSEIQLDVAHLRDAQRVRQGLGRLAKEFGMERIMTFLDLLREGRSRDEASGKAFGIDYASLIDSIRLDGKE